MAVAGSVQNLLGGMGQIAPMGGQGMRLGRPIARPTGGAGVMGTPTSTPASGTTKPMAQGAGGPKPVAQGAPENLLSGFAPGPTSRLGLPIGAPTGPGMLTAPAPGGPGALGLPAGPGLPGALQGTMGQLAGAPPVGQGAIGLPIRAPGAPGPGQGLPGSTPTIGGGVRAAGQGGIPGAAPGAGQGGVPGAAGGGQGIPGLPTAGAALGIPTFASMLEQQFGVGNPFAPSPMFNDPLQAAQDRAQYLLGQNIAGIRERFGQAGMGNSARAALAQGSATGEAATGLGRELGLLGVQQRQSDIDRALQAVLGAGSLQQNAQRFPLEALQILGNMGAGLMGAGREEQVPALLSQVLPILVNFASQYQTGRTGTR